jgi:hypothetical protein
MQLDPKYFYFEGWEYFVLFIIVLIIIFSIIHSVISYKRNGKNLTDSNSS